MSVIQKKIKKRKIKKNIEFGIVHIQSTFNNTIVSVSDIYGNVISSCSSGSLDFKGAKKSTPFAAQLTSETAVKKAMDYGLKRVEVQVKGPGSGRESAIRVLDSLGVKVLVIKDVTPIPHNGCRPSKRRRV